MQCHECISTFLPCVEDAISRLRPWILGGRAAINKQRAKWPKPFHQVRLPLFIACFLVCQDQCLARAESNEIKHSRIEG